MAHDFKIPQFLKRHYMAIADDPQSTIEQKFRALKELEKVRAATKIKRASFKSNLPHLRKQKASPPVEVKKPDVCVDEKLLGTVGE